MPEFPFLPKPGNRPAPEEARALIEDARGFIDKYYERCQTLCTPLALEFLAQSTEELLIRHIELFDHANEPAGTERAWITYWLAALAAHLRKFSVALDEKERGQ